MRDEALLQRDKATNDLSALQTSYAASQSEVAKLNSAVSRLTVEIDELKRAREDYKFVSERRGEEAERLKTEAKELRERMAQVSQDAIKTQMEFEEARQSSLRSLGELNVAQTKLRQSEAAVEAARAELAELATESRRSRAELTPLSPRSALPFLPRRRSHSLLRLSRSADSALPPLPRRSHAVSTITHNPSQPNADLTVFSRFSPRPCRTHAVPSPLTWPYPSHAAPASIVLLVRAMRATRWRAEVQKLL